MQRAQLETALTAAAKVAGVNEFILVGSQSVHAHTDAAPVEVLVSRECDIWAKARFEKLTIIEDPLRTERLLCGPDSTRACPPAQRLGIPFNSHAPGSRH